VFTTDNGTEVFTWPDGGQTPFAQSKGTIMEGGFRAPAMIRWPGKVPAARSKTASSPASTGSPTFLAAAGNPNIVEELKKGKQLGDRTLQGASRRLQPDGHDHRQRPVDRQEIWYFGESELAPCASATQVSLRRPARRLAGDKTKADVPYLTTFRLDPFERTGWPDSGTKTGSQQYFDWFKYEFWRFVFVQQQVEKLVMTAVEYPPMQKGASFNLDAVKAKIAAARAAMGK